MRNLHRPGTQQPDQLSLLRGGLRRGDLRRGRTLRERSRHRLSRSENNRTRRLSRLAQGLVGKTARAYRQRGVTADACFRKERGGAVCRTRHFGQYTRKQGFIQRNTTHKVVVLSKSNAHFHFQKLREHDTRTQRLLVGRRRQTEKSQRPRSRRAQIFCYDATCAVLPRLARKTVIQKDKESLFRAIRRSNLWTTKF